MFYYHRWTHSRYFEPEDLTYTDGTETVFNNKSTAVKSSPLRPTYSNFDTPDPTEVSRMSTFNPEGDVIPTLIRTYSGSSLSRNRVHTVVENLGKRELTDDEVEFEEG